MIAHCRSHLVRSYPAGTRFTSSNYLPLYYWAVGIQLVSLNWQTYDLGLEINTAFFQRNGRSGYILKPDILRIKRDEEKDKESLKRIEKYRLDIEILSAQQLPKPRIYDPSTNLFTEADEGKEEKDLTIKENLLINPFIEITLLSPNILKEDINNIKYKTGIVIGNGFNPTFNNNKFKIDFNVPTDMLDLAFLRIEVLARIGSDDLSLGKYTVSLPVLMPGKEYFSISFFFDKVAIADEYLNCFTPSRSISTCTPSDPTLINHSKQDIDTSLSMITSDNNISFLLFSFIPS